MGTRAPRPLVDTTPAKTFLVYRNGDQFYVGRKFVLSRRRVATFEALLEQLTEQVAVPFGVRRLYTPMRGHPVLELDALQTGAKYVAAGRERFKKLDYIHIVPRKPAKMRKLKEIKPVVHCDINVASRWQTCHRISRHINVFTNGKLFSPPIKIIIPKFSLSDWSSVLATIGEKVFPLGGVRKLFTMSGHLLDDSKDLQDNHFYVAAGLETFKHFPYWRSPRVPSEVRQRYMDLEKCPQKKKKFAPQAESKESPKRDDIPPETKDSVYHAKEGKKKTPVEPFIPSGAEGDVYKAQTPAKDAQGALEVKEDPDVKVDVPVDQAPAEVVKEVDDAHDSSPKFGGIKDKEEERRYEDIERKGDNSRMSFKKMFPLRHNTKKKEKIFIKWMPQILKYEGGIGIPLEKYLCSSERHLVTRKGPIGQHMYKTMLRTPAWHRGERALTLHPKDLVVALDLLWRGCVSTGWLQGPHVVVASLQNLNKNKKVVPLAEKEQYDILEEKNTSVQQETPVEIEVQRQTPVEQPTQEQSREDEQISETPQSSEPLSSENTSQEQRPRTPQSPEPLSSENTSQEQRPRTPQSPEPLSSENTSQEQRPRTPQSPEPLSSENPSQEQRPRTTPQSPASLSSENPSQEQNPRTPKSLGQLASEVLFQEQSPEQQESTEPLSLGQ